MGQVRSPITSSLQEYRLQVANPFTWICIFLVTPRTLCKKTSRLSLKNSSTCRNYRRLSWLAASLVLLCLAHTAAAIDPNRNLSQYIHDQRSEEHTSELQSL